MTLLLLRRCKRSRSAYTFTSQSQSTYRIKHKQATQGFWGDFHSFAVHQFTLPPELTLALLNAEHENLA